jgi:hypothetical protein
LRGATGESGIDERKLPLEEPDFRESGNHIGFYISLDSQEKTNADLFLFLGKPARSSKSQPAENQWKRRC